MHQKNICKQTYWCLHYYKQKVRIKTEIIVMITKKDKTNKQTNQCQPIVAFYHSDTKPYCMYTCKYNVSTSLNTGQISQTPSWWIATQWPVTDQ